MLKKIDTKKLKTLIFCKKLKTPVSIEDNCQFCIHHNKYMEQQGVDCDYIAEHTVQSTKEQQEKNKIINAIVNELRLTITAFLHQKGEQSFDDIVYAAEEDKDRIAYDLTILYNAGLIGRNKKNYFITEKGIETLKQIGFLDHLEAKKNNEQSTEGN